MLVILDHIGFSTFRGGYIGVDVFFVISGYLITKNITSPAPAGRFSLFEFYAKRVRRILPALLAMVIFCFLGMYHFLLPRDLHDYSITGVFTLLSVANIWFSHHVGYFDGAAADKPLLHTWSLGVEEQFYIFFPVLIYFTIRNHVSKYPKILWGLVIFLCLLSEYLVRIDAASAYYQLPARAWELLVGSALAVSRFEARRFNHARALLGVLLIVVSALTLDHESRFPGFAAIPVCAGAALLISMDSRNLGVVGKVLASPSFVYVGAISYSLYLWHWPIIYFQRTLKIFDFDGLLSPSMAWYAEKFAVLAACFMISIASYNAIERPFRRVLLFRKVRTIPVLAGFSVAMMMGLLFIILSEGFSQRLSQDALRFQEYLGYQPSRYRRAGCMQLGDKLPPKLDFWNCGSSSSKGQRVLVLGDSHSDHLVPGLTKILGESAIVQYSVTGCRPVLADDGPKRYEACRLHYQRMFGQQIFEFNPSLVILAGRWIESDLDQLGGTLDLLTAKGVSVMVVGPVPEYSISLPRLLAMSTSADRSVKIKENFLLDRWNLDKKMKAYVAGKNVPYFSIFSSICDGSACPVTIHGVPLQYDRSHFTMEGSAFVGERLAAKIRLLSLRD